jgi:hypothetical protein
MRSEEFFEKRHEIGPAVHLIVMYWAASDPDRWPWFIVADGVSLTDEEVAAYLGVSTFTAARWRRRLVATGFVQAERCGRGHRIRVQRPPFAMAAVRTLAAHSQAHAKWPQLATQFIQ